MPLWQEDHDMDSDEDMIMQYLGSEVCTTADVEELMCQLCLLGGETAEFSKFKKFGLGPLHIDCFNACQALERTLNARPSLKSRVMALLNTDPEKFRTIALAMLSKNKHEKRQVQRVQVLDFCEELVAVDSTTTKEKVIFLHHRAYIQWFKMREGLSDEEAAKQWNEDINDPDVEKRKNRKGQKTVAVDKPVCVEHSKSTQKVKKYGSSEARSSASAVALRDLVERDAEKFQQGVLARAGRRALGGEGPRVAKSTEPQPSEGTTAIEEQELEQSDIYQQEVQEPEKFVELTGKMAISKFLSAKQKFSAQFKQRLNALDVYKKGDRFAQSDKAYSKLQGAASDLDSIDYAAAKSKLTKAIESCKSEWDGIKKYNQRMNLAEIQEKAVKSIDALKSAQAEFDECLAAVQHMKNDVQASAADASRKKYAALVKIQKLFEQHRMVDSLAKAFAACVRDAEAAEGDNGVLEFKDGMTLDVTKPLRTNEKVENCKFVDIFRKTKDQNAEKLGRKVENLKKKMSANAAMYQMTLDKTDGLDFDEITAELQIFEGAKDLFQHPFIVALNPYAWVWDFNSVVFPGVACASMVIEGAVFFKLMPISYLIQSGMSSLSSLNQYLASCKDVKEVLGHVDCKQGVLNQGDILFTPFGFATILVAIGEKGDKEPPKAVSISIPIFQKKIDESIDEEAKKETFRYIEAGLSKHKDS
ncbi:unnamed protein product [Prorocentrum cordatum]|uniref:Uncharacterized protein n=1 Tax=Prorocentrum cordatum TaxID=2364126 RepID=A0ABN9X010_9DINO|nr:unnamed protein product [Polarella glacialis]